MWNTINNGKLIQITNLFVPFIGTFFFGTNYLNIIGNQIARPGMIASSTPYTIAAINAPTIVTLYPGTIKFVV